MPKIYKIQDKDFDKPEIDPKIKPDAFDETAFFYNDFFVSYDIYAYDKERYIDHHKPSNTPSINIDVDEYLITDSNSDDITLETVPFGPCIGLILYHPKTKKTLFAHCYFSNPTLEKNLGKLLLEFSTDKAYLEETQAILWGGINDRQLSIDIATILINGLKKNNIQLNTLCLFPQLIGYRFTPVSSFDCSTGKLTIDYLNFNSTELIKSEKRLAALETPAPVVVKPVDLSSNKNALFGLSTCFTLEEMSDMKLRRT